MDVVVVVVKAVVVEERGSSMFNRYNCNYTFFILSDFEKTLYKEKRLR